MKKYFSILLALVLVASLAGCSLTQDANTDTTAPAATDAAGTTTADDSADASSNSAADVDLTAAVATVGSEVLTLGEYKQTFEMYQNMFLTYYGYDIASDAETLSQYQDDILDIMIEELLIKSKVSELGTANYTAEQQAELDSRIADELATLDEYYRTSAEAEAAEDTSIDVEERIKELIAEEAEYYAGYAMTYDEYIQYTKNMVADAYNKELIKADMIKDITVSDDDLAAALAEYVESDTTTYTESPETYKDNQESYEMFGGVPCYYVPEGYHRVLHMFFAPEGDIPEEYTTLVAQSEEYEDELCELLLADAVSGNGANEARIAELLELYKTSLSDADAVLDTYMADALVRAEQAYARIEAGEDFATVMAECSEDTNYIDYPTIAAKGRLINVELESTEDWSDTVKAYFAELTLGQYSQIFQDDDGYHIIMYYADEVAGARTLDDAETKTALTETELATKQDDEWSAILSAWKNDGSVVINEELYKTIGA